jgi:hypothetical protein
VIIYGCIILNIWGEGCSMKTFKRRWSVSLVCGGLTGAHEDSIKKEEKIILNKDNDIYSIFFKNKSGNIEKEQINGKVWWLGQEKSLDLFFDEEGEIRDGYYIQIGYYIFEKIGSRSNYTDPRNDDVGYLEEDLFGLAFSHYRAAEILYRSPLTFFSGGFLLHLSLECFLKACYLFMHNQFPNTHIFNQLIAKLSYQLDSEITFIEELDKLHLLRYKFDEVGLDDLLKWEQVVNTIKDQMPPVLLEKLQSAKQSILLE